MLVSYNYVSFAWQLFMINTPENTIEIMYYHMYIYTSVLQRIYDIFYQGSLLHCLGW